MAISNKEAKLFDYWEPGVVTSRRKYWTVAMCQLTYEDAKRWAYSPTQFVLNNRVMHSPLKAAFEKEEY